jgi:hypothetical protein
VRVRRRASADDTEHQDKARTQIHDPLDDLTVDSAAVYQRAGDPQEPLASDGWHNLGDESPVTGPHPTQETACDGDGYRPQSADADITIERMLFEQWRAMDATQKAEQIDDMANTAATLQREGIRSRHPTADDRELDLRVFALRVGRDWMVRAYGWDPKVHGW